MANTKENLDKYREENKRLGKLGNFKGAKTQKTLLKEQVELDLRQKMVDMLTPEWPKLIQILINKTKTESDVRALKIAIEQAAGLPRQEIRHDVSIEKMDKLSEDIRNILENKETEEK